MNAASGGGCMISLAEFLEFFIKLVGIQLFDNGLDGSFGSWDRLRGFHRGVWWLK